jgi:archaellum biogenesis protein FlaJ (TadC family)
MEFIDDDNALNLCNECSERVDLTEYKKVFEEINKLQQQIQEKYAEAHAILAEMRKSI